MRVSIIAAVSTNGVIGKDCDLPWHLPNDLDRFKKLTLGKPVIMGRKTYESIGKPLPKRINVVITSQKDYDAPGCIVVSSSEEAILAAFNEIDERFDPEVMVIGGSKVYRDFLPVADVIYLTRVEAEVEGDTYFPEVLWDRWTVVDMEDHERDENHEHPYTFLTYKRIR